LNTVRRIVVVWLKVPEVDVPLIVTVNVPPAALLLAVNVTVLLVVGGFTVIGLNDAVTPLGRPEADKVTPLLKPF